MGDGEDQWRGTAATVAAFTIWGFVPIYWKLVDVIPAHEMIGHRILWALPFFAILLPAAGGVRAVRSALADRRTLMLLAVSAVLVGSNWFVFISAVLDGNVLAASLGYYINPLVNVLLGWCLLGERLRRIQWVAVALAGAGVLNLIVQVGELPWIALFLAVTFGLYGLVKKTVKVAALPGLFIEVLFLVPIGVALLVVLHVQGLDRFPDAGLGVQLMVPIAGLITVLPLWLFAFGTRRLTLTTVGLIQFLAPTGQFLLAVFAFDEPFTVGHVVTFVLIWVGVTLYLVDLARSRRGRIPASR